MSADRGATIYALSSGTPPAAIAVIRVSGPRADAAVEALAGRLPEARRPSLAVLRRPGGGDVLDRALVLRFPGPTSSTGEDLAEFHVHGGRSVVAAVLAALAQVGGLRPAEPGEFTRRAFENGRIDLSEAEGLADLLMAETEAQRRMALQLAGGALSRRVEDWQRTLLALSAQLEAVFDFADEADVGSDLPSGWSESLRALATEVGAALARPSIERLRDGVRTVIAGPPNAGKSSLLNVLVGREAAITSAIPGTTRDLVEAPTAIGGAPFLLIDTAGLRETGDVIETIGVERARASLEAADIILWLGDPEASPDPGRSIRVQSKADINDADPKADCRVSVVTGAGIDDLIALLRERSAGLLPREGELAINARHQAILRDVLEHLREAQSPHDPILAAESLRVARGSLDRITGRAGVEDMLDALFGTFCIGK
ncbi:tRNA uridine-5-carboxymethylaminomethyl(34) synthesis GTPase MnmE [Sphingosinicella humi]|uniref:tRNA modification GTPase MnmE n=1 Tax=Allosphingosinicella humi TaxID=2068657 RepID=A0A2U2J2C4_9SPHN|nr:tRNA uridine-5-carboxymethylaminomethyl(34) synthesis GTPase MnmE [Sphingosinicella humi]PWG02495.1 tRNA uridine-5-carboxymethylaminomethyl(34) synthesis GTPase MnmE [Sphingosinicella humi]